MKVWLDDVRPAPAGWTHVQTAGEAISLLLVGQVTEISLDHDLGEDGNPGCGYDVAVFIERAAAEKTLPPLVWNIHSANPVGILKMRQALNNADRFWRQEDG